MSSSRIYSRFTKTAPFAGYGFPVVEQAINDAAATAWATDWLPTAFSQTIGFHEGTWSAPLPERIPQDAAMDFGAGILPEPPVEEWAALDSDDYGPDLVERMASSLECSPADLIVVPKMSLSLFPAQWISEYLEATEDAVVLVREMNATASDAETVWSTVIGDFYVLSEARDREACADLLDRAASVSGELAILTTARELDASRSLRLETRDLAALVERAMGIVLGAYDGEGYIRWSRSVTG